MKQVVLKTESLSKYYGNFAALDNLNLEVFEGEVMGYLGPNGAGKTTTIRSILGLIRPTRGRAEIFGLDSQHQKTEAHKKLAFVPGEATLWPSLTGIETLYLLAQVHGAVDKDYQKQLIKMFDFEPNKKVRAYSKGNKQKINLIAAFASRAPLLIMDEPTSGLDPLMEQVFKECVFEAKSRGQTIFLSSHLLDEVEALCDRVAILKNGKLVEVGTLDQMRHLSALKVDIIFNGSPPQLEAVANVGDIKHHNSHHIECNVRGPIQPLLQALANIDVIKLLSREPSLEELFLTLYGSQGTSNGQAKS